MRWWTLEHEKARGQGGFCIRVHLCICVCVHYTVAWRLVSFKIVFLCSPALSINRAIIMLIHRVLLHKLMYSHVHTNTSSYTQCLEPWLDLLMFNIVQHFSSSLDWRTKFVLFFYVGLYLTLQNKNKNPLWQWHGNVWNPFRFFSSCSILLSYKAVAIETNEWQNFCSWPVEPEALYWSISCIHTPLIYYFLL